MFENANVLYCSSLTNYKRQKTKVVWVGDIPLGGNYPIRIQSMTNTKTLDTKATVEQSIKLIEAGCEYVRITAPGIKDAENLRNIKEALLKQNYKTPLIADIHFNPKVANIAAKYVEKVRINPGNYVDSRTSGKTEYSDKEYAEEINKIRKEFVPFLNICKKYNTAIRIGTNHGSLSNRIMSRYGDTPLGMVESAMEFLRICEEENFQNVVLSMKSSNTGVMIQTNRLLAMKMKTEGMNYPLHLGVTEAGEGEDGRIKSSVGIGALLNDGIGDTIRVSLTEDPKLEIPVARKLASYFERRNNQTFLKAIDSPKYNPYEYNKRKIQLATTTGNVKTNFVISNSIAKNETNNNNLKADFIFLKKEKTINDLLKTNKIICPYNIWKKYSETEKLFPLVDIKTFLAINNISDNAIFVKLSLNDLTVDILKIINSTPSVIIIFSAQSNNFVGEARLFFDFLESNKSKTQVILHKKYNENNIETLQIKSSCDFGALLSDGLSEGIWIENETDMQAFSTTTIAFGILQACRIRISKTEYISCPSCGRTLFDLQKTTAKIHNKTNHLKGLKIGIMGCIVNGPGEMADADYGYVGVGPGKISLYKGRTLVKRNVSANNAVDELIELIKQNGDWEETHE